MLTKYYKVVITKALIPSLSIVAVRYFQVVKWNLHYLFLNMQFEFEKNLHLKSYIWKLYTEKEVTPRIFEKFIENV